MERPKYVIRLLRSVHALLALIFVTACVERVTQLQVIQTKHGIAFVASNIEAGLRSGNRYEMLDLTVLKRDCSTDCTMWFLVRQSSTGDSQKLPSGRIDYSFTPPGMATRTAAKALKSGSYSLSATVQEQNATGEFIKSLTLHGVFSLAEGSSGNLRLSPSTSKGAN